MFICFKAVKLSEKMQIFIDGLPSFKVHNFGTGSVFMYGFKFQVSGLGMPEYDCWLSVFYKVVVMLFQVYKKGKSKVSAW